MVRLIEAENISLAWVKGCDCIMREGFHSKDKVKFHNLIVSIEKMETDKSLDRLFETHMDMKVFKRTLDIVSSEQSFSPHPNYWKRLKGQEEFRIDQIAQVISRLKSQPHSTKLTLSIYTPNDFNRNFVPCILCAELRVERHRLCLTAFVRSQDFGKKSYADYMGLGRILQRIAEGSNIQPGGMLVHTITASISHSDLNRVGMVLELFRKKSSATAQ